MKKKHWWFILIVLGVFIFVCIVCPVITLVMDSMGLIPTLTSTPTLTPTATATATQTATPTTTFTPTITFTPTLTAGEILDEAVAIACRGNFTIPHEADSSTDQPGARLCPSVAQITLPEELTANTPGSLRYIVDIGIGTIPVRNCNYEGGLTVQAKQSYHKITVYNSTTGAVVREKNVSGSSNVYCPSVYVVGGGNDLIGDLAPIVDVENAMIALLRSLLQR